MNTTQVYQYLLGLCDDADSSFVTPAIASVWLQIGEREFRRFISSIDPSIYTIGYNMTAAGSTLSLDNILLGATPTQPRLERIVRVLTMSGTVIQKEIPLVTSFEALRGRAAARGVCCFLQGRTLYFSAELSASIQIQYIPVSQVDWVTGLTAAAFIDDMAAMFGDMIALYAMQQYKIKDFAENPLQYLQLQRREAALRSLLTQGRNGDASRYFTEEDDD